MFFFPEGSEFPKCNQQKKNAEDFAEKSGFYSAAEEAADESSEDSRRENGAEQVAAEKIVFAMKEQRDGSGGKKEEKIQGLCFRLGKIGEKDEAEH